MCVYVNTYINLFMLNPYIYQIRFNYFGCRCICTLSCIFFSILTYTLTILTANTHEYKVCSFYSRFLHPILKCTRHFNDTAFRACVTTPNRPVAIQWRMVAKWMLLRVVRVQTGYERSASDDAAVWLLRNGGDFVV